MRTLKNPNNLLKTIIKRLRTHSFCSVILALILSGFAFLPDDTPAPQPAIHYAYEMNPDAFKQLQKNLYKIRKGDTLFLAKAILGKPCDEYDSTTRRAEQEEKVLGTIISYCVKTVRQGRFSESDQTIDLQFDLDEHLKYARGHNEWIPRHLRNE